MVYNQNTIKKHVSENYKIFRHPWYLWGYVPPALPGTNLATSMLIPNSKLFLNKWESTVLRLFLGTHGFSPLTLVKIPPFTLILCFLFFHQILTHKRTRSTRQDPNMTAICVVVSLVETRLVWLSHSAELSLLHRFPKWWVVTHYPGKHCPFKGQEEGKAAMGSPRPCC